MTGKPEKGEVVDFELMDHEHPPRPAIRCLLFWDIKTRY